MLKLKGKPVSGGIAMGKALVLNWQKEIVFKEVINTDLIDNELNRLNRAIKKSRIQLKKIYANLQRLMGKDPALIIDTQYILLKDGNLINDIKNLIQSQSVKAEWAIRQVEQKYADLFINLPDLSFRQRQNDISDVLNRLFDNLQTSRKQDHPPDENFIIIAQDIHPSIAANLMAEEKILGLILEGGGETSHSVILARTLGIPTVLDVKDAMQMIPNEEMVIIDGLSGEIVVNPQKTSLVQFEIKKDKYNRYQEQLKKVISLPNQTKDLRSFHLMANIELAFESALAQSHGASGIGLFRTEFLFSDPSVVLSEEQQYLIYKDVAQKSYPHPVVIRTFDIGRDKNYQVFTDEIETNPALGNMAVRLFLKRRDFLKIQIKSILRANESGNINILFPMITEIEEIFTLKRMIQVAKQELEETNQLPSNNIKVGIMIEIPASVRLIPFLKDEIDYFSIGTNDLLQYLLAVDRNNSSVSYLFNPFQPAVISTLIDIIREVNKIGKQVVVCGEMAGKPLTALMLMGMGYQYFSMNPLSIVEIKKIFSEIHFHYLQKVTRQLGRFGSKSEIEEFFIEALFKKYPDLMINHLSF